MRLLQKLWDVTKIFSLYSFTQWSGTRALFQYVSSILIRGSDAIPTVRTLLLEVPLMSETWHAWAEAVSGKNGDIPRQASDWRMVLQSVWMSVHTHSRVWATPTGVDEPLTSGFIRVKNELPGRIFLLTYLGGRWMDGWTDACDGWTEGDKTEK